MKRLLALLASVGIGATGLVFGLSSSLAADGPYFGRVTVQDYQCVFAEFEDDDGNPVPGGAVTGSALIEWNVPLNSSFSYVVEVLPSHQPAGGMGWTYDDTADLSGSEVLNGTGAAVPGDNPFPAVFLYSGELRDASGVVLFTQTFTVTCAGEGPAVIGDPTEDFRRTTDSVPADVPTPDSVPADVPTRAPTPVAAAPKTSG